MTETALMARALELARLALGRTSPNPMVGAVLVDSVEQGEVLGEGWHPGPGQPHAEIQALRDAADRGRGGAIRGSTLFVTLEPCCHTGRTGPCTEAIISAGIRRVVAACTDPNPLVAGKGFDRLRAAGIEVEVGLMGQAARELNAGFWATHLLRRPLLTAKWAMTLDGRLATDTGSSRWITGPAARRDVHQWRAQHDAILVGSGTVLADNPQLDVRLEPGDWPVAGVAPRPPRIVVVDGAGRVSADLRLFHPDGGFEPGREPIVATAQRMSPHAAALERLGARVLCLPAPDDGTRVDLAALIAALFRDHGVCSIYCEGGGRLQGELLRRGLVDRIHAYVAPKIIGGLGDNIPLLAPGPDTMDQATTLTHIQIQPCDPDMKIAGWLPGPLAEAIFEE